MKTTKNLFELNNSSPATIQFRVNSFESGWHTNIQPRLLFLQEIWHLLQKGMSSILQQPREFCFHLQGEIPPTSTCVLKIEHFLHIVFIFQVNLRIFPTL